MGWGTTSADIQPSMRTVEGIRRVNSVQPSGTHLVEGTVVAPPRCKFTYAGGEREGLRCESKPLKDKDHCLGHRRAAEKQKG